MPSPRRCLHLLYFSLISALLLSSILPLRAMPGELAPQTSSIVARQQTQTSPQSLENILQYISTGWDVLTRSMSDCASLQDLKTADSSTPRRSVLYLPADVPIPPILDEMQKKCPVEVTHLPRRITSPGSFDSKSLSAQGLLYLEHPYVVPGGQFNEMYGWDSYFIILGLLQDNRRDLARGIVENFFYEIEHYGGVLNANRTYYLSRSQPPFLTSMILAVYKADLAAGEPPNLPWLKRAYDDAAHDYEQWIEPPHLAGDTGLSRYFDHGDGPVPEIEGDPSDYYRGVVHYFLLHGDTAYLTHGAEAPSSSAIGPFFPVFVCDPQPGQPANSDCLPPDRIGLTAEYYKGDRSMRESGFDVSFRFGPFGADTHHYAPVDLNSLLYKTEMDLEEISGMLGRRADALRWKQRALDRCRRIINYLWSARRGLFFDYDFVARKQSSYVYATTFYPLWAGLASPAQAQAVQKNLGLFEHKGGLAMSLRETQAQWDYPYGWAPIHLLAADGLRHYGYDDAADRISFKFLNTVLASFERDQTIWEKYDVVTGSNQTHITAGYRRNMTGFGWTNGVFLELLHDLPAPWRNRLRIE